MGQDGHDRGQKVIATAFADLGFDVDVGPLFQTPGRGGPPGRRGRRAHRRGLLAGRRAPHPGAGAARASWPSAGREDIMIVVGGVIPPQDFADAARGRARRRSSRPGTVIAEAALRPAASSWPPTSATSCDAVRRRSTSTRYVKGVLDGIAGAASPARSRSSSRTRADHRAPAQQLLIELLPHAGEARRVGISGVPGVGQVDVHRRARHACSPGSGHRVAVLAVDPSSTRTGGSHPRRQDPDGRGSPSTRARVRPALAHAPARSAASPRRPARRSW